MGRDGRRALPQGLRSLRNRIVLPVALAAIALVVLGVVQTRESWNEAEAAEQARLLARLSSAAVVLTHHVEMEYSETNALRQRGGQAGSQLLVAARARTDTARERFTAAVQATHDPSFNLRRATNNATRALELLPAVRNLAPTSADGSVEIIDVYNQISEDLIAVADAAPAQISDPVLTGTARSVALVAALEHLAAEQLDLLRRVFTRQKLEPGELVRLAGWAGGEDHRRNQLWRLTGPASDRFRDLVNGPDVERAARLRDEVLQTEGAPSSLRADPDVWYVAQSGLLRRLRVLEVDLTVMVEQESLDIQRSAQARGLATAGSTLLVVIGTLTGAIVLAVRASRRMRRVRESALSLAHDELPEAVSRVAGAGDAEAVRGELEESAKRIDAMMAAGSDEIGELGRAFSDVHRQALKLAADQAMLRMEVEAIFVALSRRGQTLAQRQLQLIDRFGMAEPDPSRLARLYAIDHLAARMRRNEENLLVLAGGEPGRRFLTPVPVSDVIAASVEEVEDHARIEVAEAPAVAIVAPAVGDVIHLLAELLENAASFSPPSTKVRVAARRTVESVLITVFDEGIGMTPEKVAEANQRLTGPTELTSTLVGTMGLLVVSRLAVRHGVLVHLSSTPGGGTAATVTLPARLLAPEPPSDHLRRGRWRGDAGRADAGWPEAEQPYGTPPAAAQPAPMRQASAWPASVRQAAMQVAPMQPAPIGVAPMQPTPTQAAPMRPAPLQPTPIGNGHAARPAGAVPGAPATAGYTAAGLPRRATGNVPPRPAPPGSGTTGAPAAGPPDPEAARARLSSLASGIAAAQRRVPNATPKQPS